MTQKEIKDDLEQIKDEKELKDKIKYYLDENLISEKAISKYINKVKKYEMQVKKITSLKELELKYLKDYDYVLGIDEVGRGPLAGPVVAGCVMMRCDSFLLDVDDSKKIKEETREMLYDKIKEEAEVCEIGEMSAEVIDDVNILNATFKAMKDAFDKALDKIGQDKKILVLIDGNLKNPLIDADQIAIIKGDAKCYSISCASILAKVYRDRIMNKLDEKYPEYDFINNKGYGTEKHRQALKEKGPIKNLHRESFIKNLI